MRSTANSISSKVEISEITNSISLTGTLESTPIYSHSFDEISYYTSRLRVRRKSKGKVDVLHIFIPEELLVSDGSLLDEGARVDIEGYIVQSELKKMSDISVVATSIGEAADGSLDKNLLYIGGVVHKSFELKSMENSDKVVKHFILKHTSPSKNSTRILTLKVSCWNNTARMADSKYREGHLLMIKGQLESKSTKIPESKLEGKKLGSKVVLHEASAAVLVDIPK